MAREGKLDGEPNSARPRTGDGDFSRGNDAVAALKVHEDHVKGGLFIFLHLSLSDLTRTLRCA